MAVNNPEDKSAALGEKEERMMPAVPSTLLLELEATVFKLYAILTPVEQAQLIQRDPIAPYLGMAGEYIQHALYLLRKRVLQPGDVVLMPTVDFRALDIPHLMENMPPPEPPRRFSGGKP